MTARQRRRMPGHVLSITGEPFPTEHEMQSMQEAALRRERERYGAPAATIEALVFELRGLGMAALAGRNCQARVAALSRDQVSELIVRLHRVRAIYPAITDDLLLLLGELLDDPDT